VIGCGCTSIPTTQRHSREADAIWSLHSLSVEKRITNKRIVNPAPGVQVNVPAVLGQLNLPGADGRLRWRVRLSSRPSELN
jgi:hypothetical protein